jgi:uncharacterized membrane protein YsdA (DUF1294 family)
MQINIPWPVAFYLVLVLVASVVCFLAYGMDKRQSVRGQPRIRERTLHLLALFGGWPGALLGRRFHRHKTQKLTFRLILWLTIALHAALMFSYLFWPWPWSRGQ